MSESILKSQILEELRRIAKRELEFEGAINPAMTLKDDLALDSMGMIVVAVGLENKFRVRLNEEDGGDLSTVGDLLSLVEQRITEQTLAGAA